MFSANKWRVILDPKWDVLGPFPQAAREQHFVSPSYPFPLNAPYQHNTEATFSSSYTDGGLVCLSQACMQEDGNLIVRFPNVRWDHLRATEGWATLQYHSLLHSTFTIYPPPSTVQKEGKIPKLAINLLRGSFFTIFPFNSTFQSASEWYPGNIYENLTGQSEAIIDLPDLSWTGPTVFHILVSGDYEIRLFGDPTAHDEKDPALDIRLTLNVEAKEAEILPDPRLQAYPDAVEGLLFSDIIGVGMHSAHGNWELIRVESSEELRLEPLENYVVSSNQTRQLCFRCTQRALLTREHPFLTFTLFFQQVTKEEEVLVNSQPIRFSIKDHSRLEVARGIPILGTYYQAGAVSFLAVAPREKSKSTTQAPIVFLHGAGVDIVANRVWSRSVPQQKHAWVLVPTGRTPWGYDWRGPSAQSVWGALNALVDISRSKKWDGYIIDRDTKLIVAGHSNGGQGALYIASRNPDRILGAIPAAAYIKAQSYVHTQLSRLSHFIDPALQGILDSSMTMDDNDLHLSNLVDIPVLAIHGGDDENVPTWHSRELINILKSWNCSADASFIEVPGKSHWWNGIFHTPGVQQFIDRLQANKEKRSVQDAFTLTVSSPDDSGSMRGYKIEKISIPGRLARLHVQRVSAETIRISSTNVRQIKLPDDLFGCSVVVDGVPFDITDSAQLRRIELTDPWKLHKQIDAWSGPSRIADILKSEAPLTMIYQSSNLRTYSVALRFSRTLSLYFHIDSQLLSQDDYNTMRSSSSSKSDRNVIVVVKGETDLPGNAISSRHLHLMDEGIKVHGRLYCQPSTGALILSSTSDLTALYVWGLDDYGLERAARLFPFRTGLPSPEWIVVGDAPGEILATGFWGHERMPWNEAMSWLS